MENNLPPDTEIQIENDENVEQTPTFIEKEKENIINSLLDSETELKNVYENFSLEQELQNDRFCELLSNGISLKDAYELCHADEILENKIASAKKQWLSELKQSIIRPTEEASQNKYGATTNYTMTKRQREALIKRAERGEIINL